MSAIWGIGLGAREAGEGEAPQAAKTTAINNPATRWNPSFDLICTLSSMCCLAFAPLVVQNLPDQHGLLMSCLLFSVQRNLRARPICVSYHISQVHATGESLSITSFAAYPPRDRVADSQSVTPRTRPSIPGTGLLAGQGSGLHRASHVGQHSAHALSIHPLGRQSERELAAEAHCCYNDIPSAE